MEINMYKSLFNPDKDLQKDYDRTLSDEDKNDFIKIENYFRQEKISKNIDLNKLKTLSFIRVFGDNWINPFCKKWRVGWECYRSCPLLSICSDADNPYEYGYTIVTKYYNSKNIKEKQRYATIIFNAIKEFNDMYIRRGI
jgi:hypothetical protein